MRHAHASRFQCRDLVLRATLAAGDDGAGMAHAFAGRRGDAGNIGHHRLAHTGPDVIGCVFLSRAADFTDHNDALGLTVLLEQLEAVDEMGALDRIAADTDTGALAEAVLRGLMHGFVGERAGARHDADAALLVNRARHDADLAFARRDHSRAVGADQPRIVRFQRRLHLEHVDHRNALGDAYDSSDAGVGGFQYRIGRVRCRHVDHGGVRLGGRDGVAHGIEHRPFEMELPALARRYAADQLRAVFDGLLGVKRALLAGETLTDHARIFIDQNRHRLRPRSQLHLRLRRRTEIVGRCNGEAAGLQHVLAFFHVGALQAHHYRYRDVHLFHCLDDAFGDEVAAHDTAEDVHQHRLHFLVGQDQLECLGHALGRSAAADVEKIGGLAAVQLDDIHGRHGETRAVDHAGDAAVERHVVQAVLLRLQLHGVFLTDVFKRNQIGMAEQGVVVEIDLGVHRQQRTAVVDDQWIDLHQARVFFHKQAIMPGHHGVERVELFHVELEGETYLAHLIGLQAHHRVDGHGEDLTGLGGGDVFDVHAAHAGGHEHHPLAGAIDHRAEIELAHHLRHRLDQHMPHRQAVGRRLMRHQTRAEQRNGGVLDVIQAFCALDTAGFAAAAGVDLGLHHPCVAADAARRRARGCGAVGIETYRHRNAIQREQLLGLKFV